MNLGLSKSLLPLILFTFAGVAVAVLTMPDTIDSQTSEHGSANLSQPKITNVSTINTTLQSSS